MSTFGRYTLVRRVGTGGMAEIWKAKAQGPAGFEKVLAIKKVLPHLVEDGEFIDMFVEEAKLVATLVHPNIVQVFDFGKVGKSDYFIAMEYVAGANLAQVLRRLGERGARLPLEVALYVVLEACKGLGHAHGKTDAAGESLMIVHRDVSPQNILLSFGGEVKVTDFGIAKVASALTRTAEGHVRGKLAYMSPEQANTRPLDNRSDLFSLGVVLYELCLGKRLFAGSSSSEIFAKVTQFHVPTDEELAKVPYEVRSIIKQALEPDPEARYQDAMEMESAMTSALGPDGIVQARHALASILQRLFDEERKLELTAQNPVPAAPEYAETHAQGPAGEGMSVSREVVPAAEPEKAPSQPSGLTLNKPSSRGQRAVTIAPGPPPEAPAAAPAANPMRRMALYGAGLIALVLSALAGNFVPAMLAKPTPTAAPTAYATATSGAGTPLPLETFVVSSATPAPTSTAIAVVTLPPSTPAPTATTAFSTPLPATPTPAATRVPATPRPTQNVVAVAGSGYLTVNARPWVQVYVDGKLVTAETPLRRHKLSAGKHTVRFQNPATKFVVERVIEVPADVERNVFVDVKTGAVTVK